MGRSGNPHDSDRAVGRESDLDRIDPGVVPEENRRPGEEELTRGRIAGATDVERALGQSPCAEPVSERGQVVAQGVVPEGRHHVRQESTPSECEARNDREDGRKRVLPRELGCPPQAARGRRPERSEDPRPPIPSPVPAKSKDSNTTVDRSSRCRSPPATSSVICIAPRKIVAKARTRSRGPCRFRRMTMPNVPTRRAPVATAPIDTRPS